MQVHTVPLLSDNYAYIIAAQGETEAAVVDPAEPEKVLAAADALGLKITTILTTHQHWDHAGGNKKLAEHIKASEPNFKVYGGKGDNIPAVTNELGHGDTFSLGTQQQLQVATYFTPCHTPGHVLFHVTCKDAPALPESNSAAPFSVPMTQVASTGAAAAAAASDTSAPAPVVFTMDPAHVSARGIVFTGDTLFVGGCGNFNKGTPEQMRYALVDVIGSLPGDTLLAVGHEYTTKNLAYASTVETTNAALAAKKAWVKLQREAGLPTSPTTVQQEHDTNVFMRLDVPEVVAYAQKEGAQLGQGGALQDATEVIRQLRASKSAWRG